MGGNYTAVIPGNSGAAATFPSGGTGASRESRILGREVPVGARRGPDRPPRKVGASARRDTAGAGCEGGRPDRSWNPPSTRPVCSNGPGGRAWAPRGWGGIGKGLESVPLSAGGTCRISPGAVSHGSGPARPGHGSTCGLGPSRQVMLGFLSQQRIPFPGWCGACMRSYGSVEERSVHTGKVAGSNPARTTTTTPRSRPAPGRFSCPLSASNVN